MSSFAARSWPRSTLTLTCTLNLTLANPNHSLSQPGVPTALTQGLDGQYYFGTSRFNLRAFWTEHKPILPIHYAVYQAEVGCKKAAAANVESVFSGAGKFTTEAPSVGAKLLQRMVKLNNNWKYTFLRPTLAKIIERYNLKFKPSEQPPSPAAPAPAPPDPP